MLGGTAGRTTLNGEGLQHQDGHSHVLASTVPNCLTYDPAFAYEIAVIIQDGIRRMYQEGESVFYYLTLGNENYPMEAMPEGAAEGILRGMYRLRPSAMPTPQATEGKGKNQGGIKSKVHLLGSGAILHEALRAQQLLAEKFEVAADVWSVTSYKRSCAATPWSVSAGTACTRQRRTGVATSSACWPMKREYLWQPAIT